MDKSTYLPGDDSLTTINSANKRLLIWTTRFAVLVLLSVYATNLRSMQKFHYLDMNS